MMASPPWMTRSRHLQNDRARTGRRIPPGGRAPARRASIRATAMTVRWSTPPRSRSSNTRRHAHRLPPNHRRLLGIAQYPRQFLVARLSLCHLHTSPRHPQSLLLNGSSFQTLLRRQYFRPHHRFIWHTYSNSSSRRHKTCFHSTHPMSRHQYRIRTLQCIQIHIFYSITSPSNTMYQLLETTCTAPCPVTWQGR